MGISASAGSNRQPRREYSAKSRGTLRDAAKVPQVCEERLQIVRGSASRTVCEPAPASNHRLQYA